MKVFKTLIISLLIISLLSGCTSRKEKQEALMKEYGSSYYEKYMSKVEGLDIAEVSLGMLRKANSKNLETYDLEKLKNCKDTTLVKMTLDNNKIIKYEFKLKCD